MRKNGSTSECAGVCDIVRVQYNTIVNCILCEKMQCNMLCVCITTKSRKQKVGTLKTKQRNFMRT